MYEVNRSVAIIRPKAPFLEWLKSLPGDMDDFLTLEVLGRNSNAMLIPPADDPTTLEGYVLQHYLPLLQAELADWCEDDSYWPEHLTPALFSQWFDIQVHSILTDMVDTPLERETFIPLELD